MRWRQYDPSYVVSLKGGQTCGARNRSALKWVNPRSVRALGEEIDNFFLISLFSVYVVSLLVMQWTPSRLQCNRALYAAS